MYYGVMIIMSDNIRLSAVLERPEGLSQCPLCIIIHGFTGDMEERHIKAVAETMRCNGIATLRVDMYGHGESDGRFEDHTLFKWLTNGMDVIDHSLTLDFVSEIWLCGHSQGGLLTMLLASMERDIVKRLFALSPAVMIPDQAREGSTLGMSFDPVNLPKYLDVKPGYRLKNNYIRVAQIIDVDRAVRDFKGKVFVAIGTDDRTVSPSIVARTVAGYSDCKYVEIPGDTHCFDNNLECLTAQLDNYLKEQVY